MSLLAQGVTIYKGKKSKTIQSSDYVEVLKSSERNPETEECNACIFYSGYIKGKSDKYLEVEVHKKVSNIDEEQFFSRTELNFKEVKPIEKIPLHDIYYVKNLKTPKFEKRQFGLGFFFSIVTLNGIGTAIHAIFLRESSKPLLASGAIQFLVGIFGVFATSINKRYMFRFHDNPWSFTPD